MSKRPWRNHFTRDWATDPFVRALDLEARMVYLELLDIAWEEGGLRQDWVTFGTYVANRIGISRRKFVACWAQIRDKFVEFSPGFWSNPKLELERIAADLKSEKSRNAAKSKHVGSADALPAGTANALPSQSQSHSLPTEESGADAPPSSEQSSFNLAPPEQATSKPPKTSAPDVAEAVTHYRRRWVEVLQPSDGEPPAMTKADKGQLVAMLKAHGPIAWRALLERYLADRDPFVVKNGHSLAHMTRMVNGYRSTARALTGGADLPRPQPPSISSLRNPDGTWRYADEELSGT